MRLPWLHRDRVEVLSALALAAEQGDALRPGFAAIVGGDPELRRWIARFEPLDRGAELVPLLVRLRLVGRDQAASLVDAAGRRLAATLRRLADGAGRTPPGLRFVRDYPLWLLLGVTAGPALLYGVMRVVSSDGVGQLYHDLGIRLPASSAFVFEVPWWSQALFLSALFALAWAVLAWWRYQPLLRYLLVWWSPGVFQADAALRLLRHAAAGATRPPGRAECWQRRIERLLRIPGSGADEPAWRRDWQLYWTLTRWTLPSGRRQLLTTEEQQVDLIGRLRLLGLLVDGPRAIDWVTSFELAEQRLADALARRRPVLWSVLVVMVFYALMRAGFAPLVEISGKMGL